MLNATEFTAAQQANLDALVWLGSKAFEGVEQLTALNLQAAKASIDDAAQASQAVLAAKDPQSLLSVQAGLVQGAAEKSAAYGKQVYDIAVASKAEFDKAAAEHLAELQASFVAAVDSATKNAPEGASSGMALFKSAIATANNTFDSLQKATRQATEAAEANFTAVTQSVTKPAAKAKRG
ncbi:TIGR01841 family phasin [Ideonella sp.]|uniref:TIGR01841 family phasin n=1 Tax=Ideonella sp. TaxID=1929293 RepID=UPI002B4847B1|nr:TIGR01841 family phasin [Ideonella sp.]HJV68453.1 TIGR01841 family phasin [Ideonella sp.]